MLDLNILNDNQRQAVTSDAKYIRIIAGAGSGKTRVLTMRIAYLIETLDIFPTKILAITFTNKAANEMKERILTMLPGYSFTPFISTIHALCVRILREDIAVLGYPKSFAISDADDQKSIIKDIYKKRNIDKDEYPINATLSYISQCKSHKVDFDEAMKIAKHDHIESLKASVYKSYEERLRELRALDFDDLILKTVYMFQTYPEVLAKWQKRFRDILVDEFQDIDESQYALIRLLVGKENSLLVVGDPDQTIYTWRGANVNIIMDFDQDYKDCQTIVLNQNYRSTQVILNGANRLISHNKHRIAKALVSDKKSDDLIRCQFTSDDNTEAMWIASVIHENHRKGEKYKDMAVLYRSNYLSRTLEKSLRDYQIPYIIYGGLRFYDRMEIKDVMCYLRMMTSQDDLAFMRIINKPKRSIGDKTIEKIQAQATNDNTTLFRTIQTHPTLIAGKAGASLNLFVKTIEHLQTLSQTLTFDALIERIVDDSGYKQLLDKDENGEERLENIKELSNDARQFQEDNPDATLDEYIQTVALYGDKEEVMEGDHLQLMTVHAAKGLEFDTVFVCGLNEGVFPNKRAMLEDDRGIEEERRLAYVAFTRARKKLYVTSPGGFSYILQQDRTESRFIGELGSEVVSSNRNKKKTQGQAMDRLELQQNKPRYQDEVILTETSPYKTNASPTKYKPGDRVIHDKFGEGIVVKCSKDVVQIAFAYPHGVKSISAKFAGLRKK